MRNLADCELEIQVLQDKVLELEEELSRKDELHLHELVVIRDYLKTVMQKYLIK